MSLEDLARYIDEIAPDGPTSSPRYVAGPKPRPSGVLVGVAATIVIAALAAGGILLANRGEESAPLFAGPGGQPAGPDDAVTGTTTAVLCPVYSAREGIPAGMSAAEAIAEELIAEAQIPAQFVPSTAIRDLSQLGGTAMFDIAADSILVQGMFEPAPDPSTQESISTECLPPTSGGPDESGGSRSSYLIEIPDDDADAVAAAALTADSAAAQALGEQLISEAAWGECRPAADVDLGPLTGTADWTEVCALGPDEPGKLGVKIETADGAPNLWFGPGPRPPLMTFCYRQVVGKWWSYYTNTGPPEQPCSASFEYWGA